MYLNQITVNYQIIKPNEFKTFSFNEVKPERQFMEKLGIFCRKLLKSTKNNVYQWLVDMLLYFPYACAHSNW